MHLIIFWNQHRSSTTLGPWTGSNFKQPSLNLKVTLGPVNWVSFTPKVSTKSPEIVAFFMKPTVYFFKGRLLLQQTGSGSFRQDTPGILKSGSGNSEDASENSAFISVALFKKKKSHLRFSTSADEYELLKVK